MTPERFADWLQGFVEIQQSETITDTQWLIIKDHLKLVFDKKTPDRSQPLRIKSMEEVLNEHFKKPVDSSYWKLGDPALTITC